MKDEIFNYYENQEYQEGPELEPLSKSQRIGLKINFNQLPSILNGYSLASSPTQIPFEPHTQPMLLGYDNEDVRCSFLMVPKPFLLKSDLLLSDILIYSRIWDLSHNNHNYGQNSCWAPNEYLAKTFGFSLVTVKRSVQKLKDRGYVVQQRKYSINPGSTRLLTPQYDFFKNEKDENVQFIPLYYGLFSDPRLNAELIVLYSRLQLMSTPSTIRNKQKGCFIFSLSQELEENNLFSKPTLIKYLKQLSELGLIQIYKRPRSPLIIRPLFDPKAYFTELKGKLTTKQSSTLEDFLEDVDYPYNDYNDYDDSLNYEAIEDSSLVNRGESSSSTSSHNNHEYQDSHYQDISKTSSSKFFDGCFHERAYGDFG